MTYLAYYLLNHKRVYHNSSYNWISWSRKVTQHWEKDRGKKNWVRSNPFVDCCYVISKMALSKSRKSQLQRALVTFWQGTGQNGTFFEFLGKSFSNLEKLFLDRTIPLTNTTGLQKHRGKGPCFSQEWIFHKPPIINAKLVVDYFVHSSFGLISHRRTRITNKCSVIDHHRNRWTNNNNNTLFNRR